MIYEHITLVDENDHILGYGEKLEVHRRALLHRAFSIFVYDETSKKFLIQKRAEGKYHSGGLWSNACCSHPRMNESMDHALSRCYFEELGIEQEMEMGKNIIPCGSFIYLASFGSLYEHEVDHVFLYKITNGESFTFPYNKKEISELKWMSKEEIEECRKNCPKTFSAWFFKAFDLIVKTQKED